MNSVEIFVMVFCGVMGYLIVDHFLGRKEKKPVADVPQAPRQWWDVLGVSLGASEEEIQRAYRAQIGKYHPADQRAMEINLAYREAMSLFGKSV